MRLGFRKSQKRRTHMKRIVSGFLALAVSATLVFVVTNWKHGVTPVHAQGGCSIATLTSAYAFRDPAFVAPGHAVNGAEVPAAAVGVFSFDGLGGVSASYTLVINGVISTGQTGSGTYTVNSDCTGSVSFTTGDAAGLTFNIIIIGGGTEIFGIHTSPGITGAFDAKKQ
jgi:hypothetical protein